MKAHLPYIQKLLDDTTVEKILIDGWQHVYIEKKAGLEDIASPFHSEAELDEFMQALAKIFDQPIEKMNPISSFRMQDGTRIDFILPPISMIGPAITILKGSPNKLHIEDLINSRSISQSAADFLKACVEARVNIAITGMSSAGKTTLLNIMAQWATLEERILYLHHIMSDVEIHHQRVIHLETRPPNIEGKGAVTMLNLVQGALRMRPDRILVEEILGSEASELIMAMNRGYDGCLFTVNASSPRDGLIRLERLIAMGNPELPLRAVREQITSAVDLIVDIAQMRDGSRKIVAISEVTGMENGIAGLSDIFLFQSSGYDDGIIQGSLHPTGLIPHFLDMMKNAGIQAPLTLFTPDNR